MLAPSTPFRMKSIIGALNERAPGWLDRGVPMGGRLAAGKVNQVNHEDGTNTAIAQVSHLSPFEIFAPGLGTPVPQLIFPVTANGVRTLAGW